jgi:glycosyltransferase involved in cell wall biosynthesis
VRVLLLSWEYPPIVEGGLARHVRKLSEQLVALGIDVFGVPASRVTAIPDGIDPTDLQPAAELPRLRTRFAEPDEKLVLLVGRLVYEKGFHLALDAMPGLIERFGGVRFLGAGSGTAEAELKAQAERLGLMGHGVFVGWTGEDVLHSLYEQLLSDDALRDRLVAAAGEWVLRFDWADTARQTTEVYGSLRARLVK